MTLRKFIFWSDNCAAQNKNWWLFTALVRQVTITDGPELITIKYFEPGHTHMSSDSFHKHANFLQKRIIKQIQSDTEFSRKYFRRDVDMMKKKHILTKLCPHMIPNRRKFWKNLHVTENVRDLINDDDDEDLA